MKPQTGYAPMINGRILIDEIVSHKSMKGIRCRTKRRTRTGRITSQWLPETSWRKHWTDLGATIVKVAVSIVPST